MDASLVREASSFIEASFFIGLWVAVSLEGGCVSSFIGMWVDVSL